MLTDKFAVQSETRNAGCAQLLTLHVLSTTIPLTGLPSLFFASNSDFAFMC